MPRRMCLVKYGPSLAEWIALPKTTVPTSLGETPDSCRAACATATPICVGVVFFNIPPYVPKAVLLAATIKIPEK
ncbi:hypothetical protein M513_10370 [Trichuris suis]|uniref:Uncharacterized protein n=1 Tax=Trichuris suis TaxID=68888 RepID=A0A085LUU4_9BILA|nr:hypothetical protein M513_10370 [Trichuris suis]